MRLLPSVMLAFLLAVGSLQPQAVEPESKVLGGFRLMPDGVGFMVVEGRLLVEVLVIQNEVVQPGIFFLDTGAIRALVLEKSFAEKLRAGSEGTISLKFGHQHLISGITPIFEEHPDCRRFAKKHAAVLQGRSVCGAIGYPVLKGKKVVLDYAEFRLKFPPLESENSTGASTLGELNGQRWEIPYRGRPAPLCVNLNINGTEGFLFQISTCCFPSWIKKERASAAHWRRGKAPSSFQVAGKELQHVPQDMEFRSFEKGDTDVPAMDGILGNDFLMHFIVTLDTMNNVVLLRPIKPVVKGTSSPAGLENPFGHTFIQAH